MASRGKHAQLKQMYTADFETCDAWSPQGDEVPNQRVWLCGFKNLETMETTTFTSLEDFMGSILSRGNNLNREYAFHNLKFDGSFIVPWLLKNNYRVTHDKPEPKEFSVLIDERNNWYTIQIQVTKKRRVLLWNSLKLFPTSLEYINQSYGTPTEKIKETQDFYTRIRDKDHEPTKEELSYLENDLQVLAETLNEHIRFYGLQFKKTQASQSFYNFEKHFKAWRLRFPPLDIETDESIRKGYWGGISHADNLHRGKDCYDINVYDINSSYPSQLAYKKLPYGRPTSKTGQGIPPDMSKFWVCEGLVKFKLKENKVPCIPTKSITEGKPITLEHWLSDSEGIVRMVFCCIDYETILQSYDFEVISWEWCVNFPWKVQKEIQTFILENNDTKVKYKKLAKTETDPERKREYKARSQRAKIDNNSFYGKFGEEIIKRGKTPYLSDLLDDVIYRVDREDILKEGKRKYLPIAIATTAYGRQQLVTMANALGENFLYCDTDSIHYLAKAHHIIEEKEKEGLFEIDPTKLGAWHFEGHFDRGRYLRSKCYYEERYGETPEVTLAGLPSDKHTGARSKTRSCCTWDNFHIGLTIEGGNGKLRTIRTPTGNKLVPTDFQITEKIPLFG